MKITKIPNTGFIKHRLLEECAIPHLVDLGIADAIKIPEVTICKKRFGTMRDFYKDLDKNMYNGKVSLYIEVDLFFDGKRVASWSGSKPLKSLKSPKKIIKLFFEIVKACFKDGADTIKKIKQAKKKAIKEYEKHKKQYSKKKCFIKL